LEKRFLVGFGGEEGEDKRENGEEDQGPLGPAPRFADGDERTDYGSLAGMLARFSASKSRNWERLKGGIEAKRRGRHTLTLARGRGSRCKWLRRPLDALAY
jgi:hypothetical protein